jgi:hypothetical protein
MAKLKRRKLERELVRLYARLRPPAAAPEYRLVADVNSPRPQTDHPQRRRDNEDGWRWPS